MKKLFLVALASISLSVFAGEKVVENTVVTTNDLDQVTKVVEIVKGNITNTIVFIDRDFKVPLKYRARWFSMTEDEKAAAMTSVSLMQEPFEPVKPLEVEYISTRKIKNIESTRVVRLREDDENE